MEQMRKLESLHREPSATQYAFVSDLLIKSAPDLHEVVMGYGREPDNNNASHAG